MKSFKVLPGLFVALLLFVTAQTALAQSTIFNIPSTDTVDKGKGYFEFDFLPQMPGSDSTRIYTYNPRLVAGVAKNAMKSGHGSRRRKRMRRGSTTSTAATFSLSSLAAAPR